MLKEDIVNKINITMKKGYQARYDEKYEIACEVWGELWEYIKSVYNSNNYDCINELDEDYTAYNNTRNNKYSDLCIYNWVSDYENMLNFVGHKDSLENRIKFGNEYIDMFDLYYNDCDDEEFDSFGGYNYQEQLKFDLFHILDIKGAIAESYFRLGDKEQAANLIKKEIEENPEWGNGWIKWSYIYRLYDKENNNIEKSINILKQALKVEYLDNRLNVQTYLKDLYESAGMTKEAEEIEIGYEEEGIPVSELNNLANEQRAFLDEFSDNILNEALKITKVGRNDLCPCKSGKKYKKCCMNK